MMRRAGVYTAAVYTQADLPAVLPQASDSPEVLERKWRVFINRESYKRYVERSSYRKTPANGTDLPCICSFMMCKLLSPFRPHPSSPSPNSALVSPPHATSGKPPPPKPGVTCTLSNVHRLPTGPCHVSTKSYTVPACSTTSSTLLTSSSSIPPFSTPSGARSPLTAME